MTYKIEIYGTGWTDVSDYLSSGQPFPFIDRNRDYECKASGFSFGVSFEFSTNISKGDEVKVSRISDSAVMFSGYVAKVKADYNTKEYRVEVDNYLMLLTKKNISHEQDDNAFHEALVNGAMDFTTDGISVTSINTANDTIVKASHGLTGLEDYIIFNKSTADIEAFKPYSIDVINTDSFQIYPYDNLTPPAIDLTDATVPSGMKFLKDSDVDETLYDGERMRFHYMLIEMFNQCGLTLSTTGMSTSLVGTFSSTNYHIDDFNFDYENFWLLNQEEDEVEADRVITYFDYLQKVCAMMGMIIVCTGHKTYRLYTGEDESYSYTDDNFYEYDEEEVEADHDGVKFTLKAWNFSISALETIDEYESGSGEIRWYNNLYLNFGVPNASGGKWLPSREDDSAVRLGLHKYIRALSQDYTRKTVAISPPQHAVKQVIKNYCSIDERKPVSEIIEESYS